MVRYCFIYFHFQIFKAAFVILRLRLKSALNFHKSEINSTFFFFLQIYNISTIWVVRKKENKIFHKYFVFYLAYRIYIYSI